MNDLSYIYIYMYLNIYLYLNTYIQNEHSKCL